MGVTKQAHAMGWQAQATPSVFCGEDWQGVFFFRGRGEGRGEEVGVWEGREEEPGCME